MQQFARDIAWDVGRSVAAPLHGRGSSFPSDLALLWPLKLSASGVLKSAVGPAPTFTDTPTVDSSGVIPGDGPSFSSVVTWSDGGTLVVEFTATVASADLVGDVQVFGTLYANSSGLIAKDGTNEASVVTSWGVGDVVTGVVQVDDGYLRVGRAGETSGAVEQVGSVVFASGSVRGEIAVDGKTAFAGRGYLGVISYDVSDPLNPAQFDAIDVAIPSPLESRGPSMIAPGKLVVVSRGGPDYTEPTFKAIFGDGDLSEFSGSIVSATGASIIGNHTDSYHYEFCAKSEMNAAQKYALAYKTITGGEEQWASWWMKIDDAIATGGVAQLRIFSIDATSVVQAQISWIDAETFRLNIAFTRDGGPSTIVGPVMRYGEWYQIKFRHVVHASTGGVAFWIRQNYSDAWVSGESLLNQNTSAQTPNRFYIGIQGGSATIFTNLSVLFSHVACNVGTADIDTVWGDDGKISILDVSNPAAMSETGSSFCEAKHSAVAVHNNIAYVASQNVGLTVYDVSGDVPIYLASYWRPIGEGFETQGIAVKYPYVFLANYYYGLAVMDVSDLSDITEVARVDFASAVPQLWEVILSPCGNYLYGTVMRQPTYTPNSEDDIRGFVSIDVSDPTSPVFSDILQFNTNGWCSDLDGVTGDARPNGLVQHGSKVYVANGRFGGKGSVVVVDVSTPMAPALDSNIEINADAAVSSVAVVDGRTLIVGGGPVTTGTMGLYVVDVSGDTDAGHWTAFDSTLPDLSLAPTAPGDLKAVQCWSKVASVKEIGKY